MIVVRNVRDFVKLNDKEVRKFFQYKTGIMDPDLIQDHLQEFYKKLHVSKALETYDENRGNFDTYIMNQLCWLLPYLARKNSRFQHPSISCVSVTKKGFDTDEDVYNFVSHEFGMYKIDRQFSSQRQGYEDSIMEEDFVDGFRKFIRKTESKRMASHMLCFIDQRTLGCRSCEIADTLRVSDNMVAIIKRKVRRKYELWQRVTDPV